MIHKLSNLKVAYYRVGLQNKFKNLFSIEDFNILKT